MELIRVKSRLAQPYAGAFLKKEDRYVTSTIVFILICMLSPKTTRRILEISDLVACYIQLYYVCYLNQSLCYTIYSSHEYGMSYALVALLNTGCTKCC